MNVLVILIALVCLALLFVASLLRLRVLFPWVFFFSPLSFVFNVRGLHITTGEVFLSILMVAWFIRVLAGKEGKLQLPLLVPALSFLAGAVASAVFAAHKGIAFAEVVQWVWIFALFYFFVNILCRAKTRYVMQVLTLAILAAVILVFLGIYQYLSCDGPNRFLIHQFASRMRAFATFGQPNPFGTYLVIMLFLLMGMLFARPERGRWFLRVSLFFIVLGIVITFSRAAFVSAAGGLLVYFAFASKRRLKPILIVATLFAMSYLFVFVDIHYIMPRWGPDRTGLRLEKARKAPLSPFAMTLERAASNRDRIRFAKAAVGMWKRFPLLGSGPGNYPFLVKDFQGGPKRVVSRIVHNTPLQLAAEYGTVGLFFFTVFAIGVFLAGVGAYRKTPSPYLKVFLLGVISSFAAVVMNSLFGWPFTFGVQEPMFLILALLVCARTFVEPDSAPEV